MSAALPPNQCVQRTWCQGGPSWRRRPHATLNRSRPSDPCAPPRGVDTAKVLAFPMVFTRLSGVARQGRKATQGEAGNMKKSRSKRAESPSELIDARIEDLGDWRGEMLSRLRALIKEADPEVAEEWKWRGTPVWSHNGLICTGETYKNVVKMTFAKGASLKDPSGLFNSSLEGNVRRAIDFHEGDKLDEEALKALIRAAVALNKSSARG